MTVHPTTKKRIGQGVLAAATVALAACGGGGGGEAVGQGTLRMALTDAPACGYDHVWVTVDRVRVHQGDAADENTGGWREIVLAGDASERRIDLLDLTNGKLKELGQIDLPAGQYRQLRLVLAENDPANPLANAVQLTGSTTELPLDSPSAQQSGLKLKNLEISDGQTTDMVLDFDACSSIVKAGNSGKYILKPVLTLLPRAQTGIQGYVSTTLTMAGMQVSVSAQQGGAVVRSTVSDKDGLFRLPLLPAGNYDLVITASGRSTAVVTGVPVTATSMTSVNDSAKPILLPTSAERVASGSTYVGSGTATRETEATVAASQVLTGGPTVLIARTPVDASMATWTLKLPVEAPVKAAYSSDGTLSFEADTSAAGQYRLQASAPSRTTLTEDTDLSTADQVVDFHFAP